VALDPAIEIQTGEPASATVIWLHGLGADGHDFAGIIPELRLAAHLKLRFVFPHAPHRPVTMNNGSVMRALYDMAFADGGLQQDRTHLAESVRHVHSLIERELLRGIAASRIVLAGFSQGGAVALQAALRFSQRLAGTIVLSAPVPYIGELLREADPANADLPIFVAHGKYDELVPFSYGANVQAQLQADRRPVECHAYDIGHSVNFDEIADIGRFLTRVLA
jgi:phospholipase/carboxylesterase